MVRWRLTDRRLEFGPPLAAGIVNVTADSFFAGARSGTPERAVADGLDLVESGFDLLDVGAVAARSGPAVAAEEEAERLVPAIERPRGRVRCPGARRHLLAAGRGAGNRCRRGGDQRHRRRRGRDAGAGRRARLRLRAHAHRGPATGRPPGAGLRRRGRAPRGVVRGAARSGPPSSGSSPSGSRSTRGSTSTSTPTTTSSSCAGSASCGRWAGRCSSPSRARTSSARSSPARGSKGPRPISAEAATLAATALAVAQGAEVLRLHDATALDAMRTAAAITGAR